ncbi:MtrB/PioB family outer membrane beta-barrel protein [Usitatibacter palustris]|uniref:MtrB/PioB family decaheme-associated outer membrane protein n=1 Tax=Usitatibacter palustris TaxID=2732487 RepID=A0A6M4HC77_9PROT|nr:MtrB/PioB family outer membrane beta-barrel protein [Usitatibacter palustris]QJR15607.1 hypothetical protein DSM104440_02429 [Usitatibacter palustris]
MNRKLIAILVANVFAAATSPAFAQSSDFSVTGTASVGGIMTDTNAVDASKLNEYQDLSSGLMTLFDIRGRGSRYWFDLFGENLGRDDQYIAMRGGLYDVFKYRLSSDSLRHNFLFNGRTPYSGAGSDIQTAAPPFPRLNQGTWNNIDMGYKRRDDAGMFEYQGTDPWYFRVDGNQVTTKGTKPGAASQGLSPGNGFVDLSLPVDYVTRNVSVEGGYTTRTMHFNVSWMTSKFETDNEAVTWQNGYWGNGIDRTALAADNKYTRVMANATFRQLPLATTLAARYTSDELESDVGLPGSVLSTTTGGTSPTGATSSTFGGKVTNKTLTLSAVSAPMKALDTRLYYNYRERDDESSTVSFENGAYVTEPFSYEKDNYGFEAFYRLDRGNRIGVGYDYLETDREGRSDFDRTKDRRLFAEWKSTSLEDLSARLKYQRLERESNFLHANDGTSSTDVNYLNRYVTAFDLSNVDQDLWKLTLDWTPFANLDLGFEGIIKNNKFKDNSLGRLKDDRREIYVNASYAIPGGARFTVFGDSEEIKYDSTHRIIGSGTTTGAYDPASPANASNYNWSGKIKDRNWAVGAAFDCPMGEKLSIKASAIYYKTDGTVDLALQDGVPTSVTRPLPIADWDDTRRTSFTLKAVYAFSKTWSFTAGYAYERYEYKDSQFDGYRYTIPASTNQDSYLSGVYANPQYKANFLYGLVNYRF